MIQLNDYVNEVFTDKLGNNFDKGDYIEFDSKDITVIGQVISVSDNDYTVKTMGFRYDASLTEDEINKLKTSLKSEYKLNLKRKVYKLEFKNKD